MISQFENVIEEFGKVLEIDIKIPDQGPLTLVAENRYQVQFRVDQTGHFIELVAKVAELPPGAFSTRVFKEALAHNQSKRFRYSILGFSTKTKHLIAHAALPLQQADGEELSALYAGFVDSVKSWTEALERGDAGPPRASSPDSPGQGPAPFGLKM